MGKILITVVCCTFHQPTKVSVGKNTLESLRSQFFWLPLMHYALSKTMEEKLAAWFVSCQTLRLIFKNI